MARSFDFNVALSVLITSGLCIVLTAIFASLT